MQAPGANTVAPQLLPTRWPLPSARRRARSMLTGTALAAELALTGTASLRCCQLTCKLLPRLVATAGVELLQYSTRGVRTTVQAWWLGPVSVRGSWPSHAVPINGGTRKESGSDIGEEAEVL